MRPIVLEFFLGCLAAFLIRRFRPRVSGWWLLLPCALLGALAGAEWLGAVDAYTWYAAPYFLFILLGAAYDQATRRRYPPVLVLLGEASYAIYLVHFGMIMVFDATIGWFRPLADRSPNVTLTILVLAILAVGTVLHLAVERPLLATARRAVGRPTGFPEPRRAIGSSPAEGADLAAQTRDRAVHVPQEVPQDRNRDLGVLRLHAVERGGRAAPGTRRRCRRGRPPSAASDRRW